MFAYEHFLRGIWRGDYPGPSGRRQLILISDEWITTGHLSKAEQGALLDLWESHANAGNPADASGVSPQSLDPSREVEGHKFRGRV
jgi:hypothetical protein